MEKKNILKNSHKIDYNKLIVEFLEHIENDKNLETFLKKKVLTKLNAASKSEVDF